MPEDELSIEVERFGPDPRRLQEISRSLLQHDALQNWLKRGRATVLSVEAIEGDERRKPARAIPPELFLGTIYDYSANRVILVRGSIEDPSEVEVEERGFQPPPSPQEFQQAVRLISRDERLGEAVSNEELLPYPAMPAVVTQGEAAETEHRVLSVGLRPPEGMKGHTIVGVDMNDRRVITFEDNAPPTAVAHNPICGLPYAGQGTVNRGTAGSAWVTVTQGGTTVWRFLVVRPAASSGTNGSGIELRYVDYRGKRVLYRAHVPILNVQYEAHTCGPYLDWQWQEGMIQAGGSTVAPGFRLSPTPVTTILDTGTDTGNFLGVGIYVQGQEVVFVSEMHAAWYRYVSKWGLSTDGTIRPRFGFGATSNSCVCTRHYHHAYWRLDFDIRTAGGNTVHEYNDPALYGSGNWHLKRYETQRPRNPAYKRKWRVQNARGGETYEIVPGADDGVATAFPDWPFPQGDLWFTRYRGTEIDNGVVATGPPHEANIGNYVNGEVIENQDVVVWYAGHATHDVGGEEPGHWGRWVGPDLRAVKW